MQKLTLSIDDDVYALLHEQIGRGNIGRFVSHAVRPYLHKPESNSAPNPYGMLAHRAERISSTQMAAAKREYMKQRNFERIES